jgi:hypothetical protein
MCSQLRLLVLLAACLLTGCQASPIATLAPTGSRPADAQPLPTATRPETIYLPGVNGGSSPASPDAPTPAPPPATPTRTYPVYSGPPLDRGEVGLQIHLHREDISLILSHLSALQVGWVKVQVSWKMHEPEPGRYDQVLFRELDQLIAGAAANGISVLLSVTKAPEWSRPTAELDGPPTERALFAAFMGYLASRYQGRVAAYELWNEPNLRREWNGFPLSAADFVSLVRAGATGVEAADPLAIIISGAPAPTGIHDHVNAIDDRVYLSQMVEAGVTDIVDAIGAHPYGWANPPDASARSPDPTTPSHNDHPSFFFRDTLWDYFTILNQADRSEKEIWVTEFGWGSFDGMGVSPPTGAEFMAAVSEWQQATYTLRAYELAHTWRWMGPLFLWNLNFGPLLGTGYSESGYSLLRPDGSPRPAYLALRAVPKQ